MTNSGKFLESVLNQDHYVYGLKLRPLTLFHIAYLEQIQNPLMTGGEIQPGDILEAAIVCSCKNQKQVIKKFSSILLPFLPLFYDSSDQYKKWTAYYEDHLATPEFWESDGQKDKLPFILTCAAAVIKITGWDFATVFFKMPIGQILWLNTAFAYLESGKSNIKTDDELMVIEYFESLKGTGHER